MFGIIENNESVKALFVSSDVYDELKMGGLFQIPTLFIVENPEVSFYYLHHLLHKTIFYEKYDFKSEIGNDCSIHKTAVIEDGVILGDGVQIGANSVIKRGLLLEIKLLLGVVLLLVAKDFN